MEIEIMPETLGMDDLVTLRRKLKAEVAEMSLFLKRIDGAITLLMEDNAS